VVWREEVGKCDSIESVRLLKMVVEASEVEAWAGMKYRLVWRLDGESGLRREVVTRNISC
jgi:hypothetical protein